LPALRSMVSAPMTTPQTSASSHDDAEWMSARPGERFTIRIPAAQTGGVYAVVEFDIAPGDSTSVHQHEKEDEHFVILEGTARFRYGDKTFDVRAGESVSALRGIPHAWGNATDKPLRFICIATPGGCEEALVIMAKGGAIDLPALAERFRVRIIAPPLLG
jgi:quercetin dioxygenase-like cupin family protein